MIRLITAAAICAAAFQLPGGIEVAAFALLLHASVFYYMTYRLWCGLMTMTINPNSHTADLALSMLANAVLVGLVYTSEYNNLAYLSAPAILGHYIVNIMGLLMKFGYIRIDKVD